MNCTFCGKYFAKKQLAIDHMNRFHGSELDNSGMDAAQNLYYSTHGSIHGSCACGCGKQTEWNMATGKPYKLSNDPKCRERMNSRAKANMMKVYGKTTLLDDMEQQKEMQKNRPTAGEYIFADGGKVNFLSKPEERFLKFCDQVLELPSHAILESPEVFTYYDSKDQRERKYIPDYYLPDYNLLIEIKDGGKHPNTNPAFVEETKYKVAMKDEVMKKQTKYNYIKIVDSNFGPFMELLYQIVHVQGPDDYKKPKKALVVITENACVDLDEQMDFVSVTEKFKELYLIVVTCPVTDMMEGIGISESSQFYRIYYDNFLRNVTYEASRDDMEFKDKNVYIYKCMASEESINQVLNLVITILGSAFPEPVSCFSLNRVLGEHCINFTEYFNSQMYSNNEEGLSDFIAINQYFVKHQINGEEE